jgi:signal transduction histidine kinase
MLKRIENLRLMAKMAFPIAVMLMAALGIVAFAERALFRLTDETHEIIRVTAARQALALSASASVNGIAADEKNAMLMTDKAGLDIFASGYVTEIDRLKQDIAGLKRLTTEAAETERLDRIAGAIHDYYATGEQLYQLMVTRQFDQAHALSMGAAQAARERLIALIQAMVEETTAQMQQADGQADRLYRRTFVLLIVLSVVGLLGALLTVVWITRRFIVGPLTRITNAMGRLSQGDMDIDIEEADRHDEIGILARALAVFHEHSLALRQREIELRAARDEAIAAAAEQRASQQRERELERQLRHSQKLEALGTLAGGMAHDLNNALMPILALSQIVLEDIPPRSRAREDVETIRRSGERARDLVQQILAFARKQELAKGRIDLAVVTHDALRMLRATLPATVELVEQIEEVPPLLGNAGQLQQVIVNLVSNAAQAIGERNGRITISLSTSPASIEGSSVASAIRLAVTDTGNGIDEAALDRIFEPFFTTKPVGEGTGLGLSVVHGIVAGHGGRIDVRSRRGSGSEFIVLLPVLDPAAVPAAAEA